MIYLKNVRVEGNKIIADYYPEDSSEFSRVEYDVKIHEFKGKMVGYEMEYETHLAHAKFALMDMADGEREIRDTMIMCFFDTACKR